MRLSASILGLVTMSILVLAGCSQSGSSLSSELIPSASSPVADAPVPAGFSLMKSQSTSRVILTSNRRSVDHQYSGSDDYLPVVRFYQDQMPKNGWTMVDQNQSQRDTTLHFTKANEDCFVTVIPGGLVTHTHIRIRIDPKGPTTQG